MKVSLTYVAVGVFWLLAASALLGMPSEASAKSPDSLQILDLLQNKKYRALDAILTEQQQRYEKGSGSGNFSRRCDAASSKPSTRSKPWRASRSSTCPTRASTPIGPSGTVSPR